jgi:N6-adenosine-specific RNA methylase IME4
LVCQSNIQLDDVLADSLPPLSDEERQGLEEDILRDGCLSPLIVWNGTLVDGYHRYAICRKHGIPFKVHELEFDDLAHACYWVVRHHKNRRNLTAYRLVESVLKLELKIAQRAKANQQLGGRIGAELTNRGSQNSENPAPIDTYRELAKEAGVSHDTIAKGKYLHENADDKTKEKLRSGKTTIHAEYTRLKREEKECERQARRAENAQRVEESPEADSLLTSGARFATIVVDPPWDWGDEGDCDQLGRARPTYGTMPFEELLALPVADLADRDCHLYLWITNRSLPKGFTLLERWGFRYITALTWCKPSFGMGNYFRGSTEHVLFGVKGSQPLRRKDVGTWFQAPRGPLGHSSKPVALYELVESCSPGPYLEMFARSERAGWSSWGAEVDGH